MTRIRLPVRIAITAETGAFTEDFAIPEDCREGVVSGAYSYAAKLICGVQVDPEDSRLTQGRYASTINIHNPGAKTARFAKTLAFTFPPREQKPGEVKRIAEHRLAPERALAADCDEIRRQLYPDGWPASYVEGFVLIRSEASLDVIGVYTKSALNARTGGVAIDVEVVQEQRLEEEDPQKADLIPVPDANGQFCRLRDGRLAVTARNQGAGSAGASTTLVDFGTHGQNSTATPMLAAGASSDHLVAIPTGCFDPDCDFQLRVDVDADVDEDNETNNEASGLCLG